MADQPASSSYRKKQNLYIAGICAFAFLAQSSMTYQTVYLKENGFTASQLGLFSSMLSVTNIFALSFWGIISDRSGTVKRILIPITSLSYLLLALLPVVSRTSRSLFGASGGDAAGVGMGTFLLFTVFLAFTHFFYNPAMMLNENLIVRDCAELDLNYGRNRSIGSLTYSIGGFIATAVASRFGTGAVFITALIAVVPLILCYIPVRDGTSATASKPGKKKLKKEDVIELLSSRAFQIFLGFAVLMHVASACRQSFLPYFMTAINVDTSIYGTVIGYGAIMEIPSILMLKRLHDRISYKWLLAGSAALFGFSCLLMATVANSLPWLFVISTMFGLANGMGMTAGYNYVYELAPASLKATGQSIYQIACSIAAIFGASAGGFAFDQLGVRPFYWLVTLVYASSVTLVVLTSRKKQKA